MRSLCPASGLPGLRAVQKRANASCKLVLRHLHGMSIRAWHMSAGGLACLAALSHHSRLLTCWHGHRHDGAFWQATSHDVVVQLDVLLLPFEPA